MSKSNYFDEGELSLLDSILADIEIQSSSNDDLVSELSKICLKLKKDISNLSTMDPFSIGYKKEINKIYKEISKSEYSRDNEGLPNLNEDYEKKWPYPWGTKSPATVARFLISYGYLIKVANLPPHARILEVGCGLGSLTWNLSRMGYRVDALDPNNLQCHCVRSITKDFPIPPNVISSTLGEWLEEKSTKFQYKYDAVIFFESFHHLPDHLEDLTRVVNGHMEVDGKVFLAAEPIVSQKCDAIPYPWGPRLDGESLRAMRRWGWLELGFHEEYVKELFSRLGINYSVYELKEALPWSRIVVGEVGERSLGCQEQEKYLATSEDEVDFSKKGLPSFIDSVTGMGDHEFWGRWSVGEKVILTFANELPKNFKLVINLMDVYGPNVHKKLGVLIGETLVQEVLDEIGAKSSYQFIFKNINAKSIQLNIPHPSRPKDNLDISNEDPRFIGIAIKSIRIISDEI